MKKPVPYYPLLFAFYPALAILASNIFKYSIVARSVVLCMATTLLLVVFIWAILWTIIRDLHKSALITLVLLVVFFSYGHIYSFLDGIKIYGENIGRHRYILPVLMASMALSVFGALKINRSSLMQITKIFNFFVLVLFLLLLINIGFRAYGYKPIRQTYKDTPFKIEENKNKPAQLPNIYFIVVDRYAGVNGLKMLMDYDNTWFIDSLKSRGFIVPANTHSNYFYTHLSLTTTLNGNYLPALNIACKDVNRNTFITNDKIKNNSFVKMLKEVYGYKYIHIGSCGIQLPKTPTRILIFKKA